MELPKNSFKISFTLLVLALAFNIYFVSIDNCASHADERLFLFACVLSLCALGFWVVVAATKPSFFQLLPVLVSLALCLAVVISGLLMFLQAIITCSGPDVCTMPAGMSCTTAYLYAAGDNMSVTLVNGLQKTIVVTGIAATRADKTHVEACGSAGAICSGTATEVTMALGQSNKFGLYLYDESGVRMFFTPGDGFSGKINVQYYFKDEGPGAVRTLSGNVYAKAA
jgi:hypothetical protein